MFFRAHWMIRILLVKWWAFYLEVAPWCLGFTKKNLNYSPGELGEHLLFLPFQIPPHLYLQHEESCVVEWPIPNIETPLVCHRCHWDDVRQLGRGETLRSWMMSETTMYQRLKGQMEGFLCRESMGLPSGTIFCYLFWFLSGFPHP